MHNKEKRKQYIRKADVLLIGICLLTAAILAAWFFILQSEGNFLRISYDGDVLDTLDPEEKIFPKEDIYYLFLYDAGSVTWEKSEEYPDIPAGVSFNLLCVSSGGIRMEAADCKDQICVEHKPISGGGENIICLPHRLVVEVAGEENDGAPDGMVE